ncbi:MAG: succinylglutamate desuccinylase/aspartoacylase family protein [Candidatus Dormibacteria bacterium]|jgi:predicted deacylase
MIETVPGKWAARIEVSGVEPEPATFVPYGVIQGARPGPQVAVVAGVHGTELVTQDAAQVLWRETSPEEVRGSLTVVFVADVLAAQSGIPGANPVDRRNLNRVWPGSAAGTLSERLTARLWEELLRRPEMVIDLHGGEWTEEVDPFAIVHPSGDANLDARARGAAVAMGLPYVQFTSGDGKLSGEVSRNGRLGLAMEVGGGGRRRAEDSDLVVAAVRGALRFVGSLDPGGAAPSAHCTMLRGADLRSSMAGVLVQAVEVAQPVEQGQTVCTVTDFDGQPMETIAAPHAGLVLLRSVARVVAPEALVATVAWAGS